MALKPSDFSDELQAILGAKAEPHDTTLGRHFDVPGRAAFTMKLAM
jgi:hypothetical protein